MYLEVFPCGPIETNGILLACEKTRRACVFDAPQGCFKAAMARAKSLGFTIEKLFLTHSHWDHIADAALFKEHGVPIYVHGADAKNLIEPGSDQLPLFFEIAGVTPDQSVAEGDVIQVGDLAIEVIETPGHSPGGVCYYLAKEGVLISGDTLFRGAIGSLSLPTARPIQMRASLNKLSHLPPETKVYPGHGDPTTIYEERRSFHA